MKKKMKQIVKDKALSAAEAASVKGGYDPWVDNP